MRSPALLAAAGLAAIAVVDSFSQPAAATSYTSSSAFDAATAGDSFSIEQYGSGSAGQLVANGETLDGLTYQFVAGPSGDLQGGIITSEFDSFSGLSLGGNQSDGLQFFFGGDSFTVTFPKPIKAVGVFFNVNQNSGNYDVDSSAGDASTASGSYDTSTFVFDGIVSNSPFASITVSSEDLALGSFNIPEIEYASVPEPLTLSIFGAALVGAAAVARRRRKANKAV